MTRYSFCTWLFGARSRCVNGPSSVKSRSPAAGKQPLPEIFRQKLQDGRASRIVRGGHISQGLVEQNIGKTPIGKGHAVQQNQRRPLIQFFFRAEDHLSVYRHPPPAQGFSRFFSGKPRNIGQIFVCTHNASLSFASGFSCFRFCLSPSKIPGENTGVPARTPAPRFFGFRSLAVQWSLKNSKHIRRQTVFSESEAQETQEYSLYFRVCNEVLR